jgi:hypothetical protein
MSLGRTLAALWAAFDVAPSTENLLAAIIQDFSCKDWSSAKSAARAHAKAIKRGNIFFLNKEILFRPFSVIFRIQRKSLPHGV